MGQVIEADETGRLVLPAELLGEARPRARYVVEPQGDGFVVQPELAEVPEPSERLTPEEWAREWQAWTEQIAAIDPGGKSALDELTDMRNARG